MIVSLVDRHVGMRGLPFDRTSAPGNCKPPPASCTCLSTCPGGRADAGAGGAASRTARWLVSMRKVLTARALSRASAACASRSSK